MLFTYREGDNVSMETGDLLVQHAEGEWLKGNLFHNGLSHTLVVLVVPELALNHKMLLTHRTVAMVLEVGTVSSS